MDYVVYVTELWVTDGDGHRRRGTAVACHFCGVAFVKAKHRVSSVNFCSPDCSAKAKQNKRQFVCKYCTKISVARASRDTKYCSRRCKETHMSLAGGGPVPNHYGTGHGQSTYRQRAFSWHGPVCSGCEYSKDRRMLDVHHVDGDRTNNKRDNLEVLCVWCHAAKTRGVSDP